MNRGIEIPLDLIIDKNNKYSGGSIYTNDIFFLLNKYYPGFQNKIFECMALADKDKKLIVNKDLDQPTFEYIV